VGARSLARWAVPAAAAGLIAIVALTSRDGLTAPNLAIVNVSTLLGVIEVIGYVAIGVGVFALPVAFAMARARARARRRDPDAPELEPLPLWMRLLGVYIVIAIVGSEVVVVSWYLAEIQAARVAVEEAATAIDDGLDAAGLGPAAMDPLPLIIAGVILVGLAVLAVVIAIRWRTLEPATVDRASGRRRATAEALEVSLDALRREPDPRKAVIAAYAAMEGSLSRAGLPRVRSEAPLEYLRRVLDVSGLAEDHLRTITLLFQYARFSDHPVRESMRTQAVEALGHLRATIGSRA
jgi:hypothetical protein